MSTVIARTVVRAVVPLILVTAIALLLQGHNLPGGGFIAGVLTATAFVLIYVIYGQDYLEEEVFDRTPVPSLEMFRHGILEYYRSAFGLGLALAAASGLAAIAFGEPFLAQTVRFLHDVPLYGELELASALVFDLGVYFTVVGALLTILAVVGSE